MTKPAHALTSLGDNRQGGPAQDRAATEWAVEELDRALAELRDIAHGIHPVVLAEDGLSGALASLAETSAVPLTISGEPVERCSGPTELAGYVVVVEVVRMAETRRSERVDVSVESAEGLLRLSIEGPIPSAERWLRLEDRVGAAGGRLLSHRDGEGTRIEVELPCA